MQRTIAPLHSALERAEESLSGCNASVGHAPAVTHAACARGTLRSGRQGGAMEVFASHERIAVDVVKLAPLHHYLLTLLDLDFGYLSLLNNVVKVLKLNMGLLKTSHEYMAQSLDVSFL